MTSITQPNSIVHQAMYIKKKVTRSIASSCSKQIRKLKHTNSKRKQKDNDVAGDNDKQQGDARSIRSLLGGGGGGGGGSTANGSYRSSGSIPGGGFGDGDSSSVGTGISSNFMLYDSTAGSFYYADDNNNNPLMAHGGPNNNNNNSKDRKYYDLEHTTTSVVVNPFEEEKMEDELKEFTISIPKQYYGEYETIDQNEFFVECMMTGSEGSKIIHFFDENSSTSKIIDEHMEKLAKEFINCRFVRIQGSSAGFVASTLNIHLFPTVAVLRNKVVLNKLVPAFIDDSHNDHEAVASSEEAFRKWVMHTTPDIQYDDDLEETLQSTDFYTGHLEDLNNEEDDERDKPYGEYYRIIDQNEFFMECLVNGNGIQVIHVIDKESELSNNLANSMESLATDFPDCRFLEIKGEWIHFVASRLQIEKFPTIIIFQDKRVLGQYTPTCNGDAEEDIVKKWLLQELFKAEMNRLQ